MDRNLARKAGVPCSKTGCPQSFAVTKIGMKRIDRRHVARRRGQKGKRARQAKAVVPFAGRTLVSPRAPSTVARSSPPQVKA